VLSLLTACVSLLVCCVYTDSRLCEGGGAREVGTDGVRKRRARGKADTAKLGIDQIVRQTEPSDAEQCQAGLSACFVVTTCRLFKMSNYLKHKMVCRY
jgi:hypothetical protein